MVLTVKACMVVLVRFFFTVLRIRIRNHLIFKLTKFDRYLILVKLKKTEATFRVRNFSFVIY